MSVDIGTCAVATVATASTGIIERPAVSPAGVLAYVNIRELEPGSLTPVGSISVFVVDGRDLTNGEDVFPVPPRWLGPDKLLYCADGAVRIRDLPHPEPELVARRALPALQRGPGRVPGDLPA